MHVVFRYSLIEEIKNLFEMLFHHNEYKNLRSVVYPSFKNVINAMFHKKAVVKECSGVWKRVEPEFNKAIVEAELVPIKSDVVCFIHSFGCEGWFNVDKNQIHVRTTQSSKENTIDSIMHELLHLVTYKSGMSYEERENLVERFMKMPSIKQLSLNI